jgi:hypothetical protein
MLDASQRKINQNHYNHHKWDVQFSIDVVLCSYVVNYTNYETNNH